MSKYAECAYDVEVLPNFFSAIFVDIHTKDYMTFIITPAGRDDRKKLRDYLDTKKPLLYGYNSHGFDDLILEFIRTVDQFDNLTIYTLAQMIIKDDDWNLDQKFGIQKYRTALPFRTIDVMRVTGWDAMMISLKWAALRMNWPRIEEMPIAFDEDIKSNQVAPLLRYNLNDVLMTADLVTHPEISKIVAMRFTLTDRFKVEVTSAADSPMALKLWEFNYVNETGIDIKELRKKRTHRKSIPISSITQSNMVFQSPGMLEFYDYFNRCKLVRTTKQNVPVATFEDAGTIHKKLETDDVKDDDKSWKFQTPNGGHVSNFTTAIGNTSYVVGVGGLHSKNDSKIYRTNDDRVIKYCDVSSYYPSLIRLLSICPAHLDKDIFFKIYDEQVEMRLREKAAGNTAMEKGLKITINSVFGRLGSNTSWFFDRKAFFTVTICGQMYLLMLIDKLESNGIEVILGNTDGIIANVPRDKEQLYREITDEWCNNTGFKLDHEDLKVLVIRDILNYMAVPVDENAKTHEKGMFVTSPQIHKSLVPSIATRQMIMRYFVDSTKPEESIKSYTEIWPFIMAQKMSRKFGLYYRTPRGEVKLQTNTRVIATKTGGTLKKRTATGKEQSLFSGVTVTPVNDISNPDIDNYNVDKAFYVDEVWKTIRQIENHQTQAQLF